MCWIGIQYKRRNPYYLRSKRIQNPGRTSGMHIVPSKKMDEFPPVSASGVSKKYARNTEIQPEFRWPGDRRGEFAGSLRRAVSETAGTLRSASQTWFAVQSGSVRTNLAGIRGYLGSGMIDQRHWSKAGEADHWKIPWNGRTLRSYTTCKPHKPGKSLVKPKRP